MRLPLVVVLLAGYSLLPCSLRAQDYVPLRANLHVHTYYSYKTLDPTFDHYECKSPTEEMAEGAAVGLNVVGFSDHGNRLSAAEWAEEGTIARPGGPIALRGFEWTPSADHCNVFGATAPSNPDTGDLESACQTTGSSVSDLFRWLKKTAVDPSHGTIVAQFNHISNYKSSGALFNNFTWDADADPFFCLAEIGYPPNPFHEPALYHSASESEGDWRIALQNGWHVAPSIGIDNQFGIGDAAVNRCTGLWLNPAVGGTERQQVMEALHARRVYASEARHARLKFRFTRNDNEGQYDWKWMGDRIETWNGDKLLLGIDVECPGGSSDEDITLVELKSAAEEPGLVKEFLAGPYPYHATLPLLGADLRSMHHTARGEVCLYLDIHHRDGHTFSAPIWITPHQRKYNILVVPSVTTALGQTAQLTARLTDRVGAGVAGRVLSITVDGEPAQNVTPTDANGYATASFPIPAEECPGSREIRVSLAGDSEYEDNSAIATLVVSTPSDNVIRVSPTGSDSNSGRCWGYPKRTIQAGVNACPEGGEVWVATGTYSGNVTVRKGVSLLGGFVGGEMDKSQRNVTANQAVSSGAFQVRTFSATPIDIDGMVFQDCAYSVSSGSKVGDVRLANNTFTNCNPQFTGTLGKLEFDGNKASGGTSAFNLKGATLTKDCTWLPQENCRFTHSGLTIAEGARLTLGPGMVIQADNYNTIRVAGDLRATATAVNPAVLTLINDDTPYGGTDTSYGAWNGLVYSPGATAELAGIVVSHADGAVRNAAVVRNGTFIVGGGNLYLREDGAGTLPVSGSLEITGNTIQGCTLSLNIGNEPCSLLLENNTFSDPGPSITSYGAGDGPDVRLANNVFVDAVCQLRGTYGKLGFDGNKAVVGAAVDLYGVALTKDNTWAPQENVHFRNYGLTIASGATLTLGPGFVIQSGEGHTARITVHGNLRSTAPPGNRTVLTGSGDDTPYGGADDADHGWPWGGLVYPLGATIDLAGIVVRHAGTGVSGSPSLVTNGTFERCGNGVYFDQGGGSVTACTFTGNTFSGVCNASTVNIDARHNDWGDPSGPYHATLNASGKGDRVSDHVIFDPWQGKGGLTYFTVVDVATALRIAAGIAVPAAGDVTRLDVAKTGTSNGRLDLLDAVRLARKAAGVEANP